MKMPTYLKIVLRLIKMECKSHEYCWDCPLMDGNKCTLNDIPCYWDVDTE